MNVNRRTIVKGLMAAGTLPLFNIGCAHFGESRARQIAKGATRQWNGSHVTNDPAADKWVTKSYRQGWDPFEGSV